MKLRLGQEELLDEFLTSEAWSLLNDVYAERRASKIEHLIEARHSYEEYVEIAASIRELDYLRAEPARLVKKAYRERNGGNGSA